MEHIASPDLLSYTSVFQFLVYGSVERDAHDDAITEHGLDYIDTGFCYLQRAPKICKVGR